MIYTLKKIHEISMGLQRSDLNMPSELSVGRITNIAKTITTLNVSKDFKIYLKERAEKRIKKLTRMMEEQTLAESPDAKTIADIHPHLSSNRVKNIMMMHSDMRIGASAVARAKEEAEKEIRELVKIGEQKSLANNAKTLMERFMDEEDEVTVKDKYVDDANLTRLISCYTDKGIRAQAITELRLFLEEEMDELVTALVNNIRDGRERKEILEMLKDIGNIVDQARIKRIITSADQKVNDRGKEFITVAEIIDSF